MKASTHDLPAVQSSHLFIVTLALVHVGHAASDTWRTTAGTGNWNTGSNWVPGVNLGNSTTTWSNTDIATFTGISNFPSVNLSTVRNLLGLTFNSAGRYAIASSSSGAGRYFLTRGGTSQMTSRASASQNLGGMFMRMGQGRSGGNHHTFLNDAASSSNVFTLGAIRNASNVRSTLLFAASNIGLNKVTGIIDETSGGANVLAVNKSGIGTWILDTANSYTGGTTVDSGTLGIGSATALGPGGLTLNGGTLASATSPHTIDNNVTVGGNFTFGGLGQSITPNGTITGGWSNAAVAVYDSMNTTLQDVSSFGAFRSTVRAPAGPPSPSPSAPPSPARCAAAGIENPSRSPSSPIFVND